MLSSKNNAPTFLAEIDKEISRKNFSFAEFEENEVDLNKLESWFKKVQDRDFIGGDQAREAEVWLEKCRETFKTLPQKSSLTKIPITLTK